MGESRAPLHSLGWSRGQRPLPRGPNLSSACFCEYSCLRARPRPFLGAWSMLLLRYRVRDEHGPRAEDVTLRPFTEEVCLRML